jgi:hypothetical protein
MPLAGMRNGLLQGIGMPHFLRRVRPVTICVRGIDARMHTGLLPTKRNVT